MHRRIIQLRKKRKLTQAELAEKIGVTRSALSQYELGTRKPDYEIVQRMADFFSVSTDYLLGRSDESQTSEELDPFVLFDLIDTMSDDQIIAKYKHVADEKELDEKIIRNHLAHLRLLKSLQK